MTSPPLEGSPREVFLAQLNEFYAACGTPRYKEIAEIAARLDSLYPLDGNRKRDLPPLSPSGISEVLAGRRKKLPSGGWLAAFVLSCQRRAWELGALDSDPGVSSLPDWHRKLNEAKKGDSAGPERPAERPTGRSDDRPARRSGPAPPPQGGPAARPPRPRPNDPGPGRPPGGTDHPPDQPPGPPAGPSAALSSGRGGRRSRRAIRDIAGPSNPSNPSNPSGPSGPSGRYGPPGGGAALARSAVGQGAVPTVRTVRAVAAGADVAESAVPVLLPPPLREYVAGYGRYGTGLLADAEAGAMDAVYRVAVLLLGAESVDGDAEAQRLLIYAGAAGHHGALDLLDANPVRLDRLDAASHAYELAETAAADRDWVAAPAFYECAARCGLPAASVKLADRLMTDGDEHAAVRWLAVAAHQGNTMAEIRLEELRRAGRVPAPTPKTDDAPGAAAADD